MPRPPAKRGRVAHQKPAAQPVQPTPSTKRRIDDIDDSNDAQKTTSAKNTALDDSRARKHETPRTSRVTGARGQQFASAIRRAGDASAKIQKIGTPGFDSSMLSNFRPRPRQPSILHLMDDDDEENSSDLDSEAFLGSFDPEDESTPLNFNRRKTLPLEDLLPSPSPTKKAIEQSQESNGSPSGSAKRRKLIAVEVPATQPDEYPTLTSDQIAAADAAAEDENEEHVQETDAELDLDDDDDEIPLPEPLDRQMSPEILSQTMVPPMSSSVTGSPVKSPKKASQPTPSQACRMSTRQTRISTATLRDNLLPVRRRRRRQRQRAEMEAFDVPSEDEEEADAGRATDEDELSYLPSKGKKGTRKALRSNKQGANKKIGRSTRSGKEKTTSKSVEATKTRLSRSGKDQVTYSRRRSQDKENDVDEVDSDVPEDIADTEGTLPVRSEELLKAKLKFEEVDRWEMDFEDVAVEQGSPYR